jgi:hypothetical protein
VGRKAAQLLAPGFIAQFFISGFPLLFKHLHECYGSMTGLLAVLANGGAPVDVRDRMNTRSPGG